MKNLLLLSLLLTIGLSSCYTNMNKQLEREVHVRIDGLPQLILENTGKSDLSGAYTKEQLVEQFMDGLRAEFGTSKIVIDDVNPEFSIQFSSFKIVESSKTETVNDSLADNNGTIFELTSLDLSSSGTVTQLSNGVSYSWNALKDKEEKVTTNRRPGEIISGSNEDKKVYREKELDPDAASSLSSSLGRRSGVVIVKEIFKALN